MSAEKPNGRVRAGRQRDGEQIRLIELTHFTTHPADFQQLKNDRDNLNAIMEQTTDDDVWVAAFLRWCDVIDQIIALEARQ